jgi:gliding motility-associated-like protein
MKKLVFILALFSLLPGKNAFADHVMGADIQWQCLTNDTFKIVFKFYRDCRGIPKSASVVLQFQSDSCANSLSGSLTCNRVSLTDITPVCSNNKPCNPANTMLTSIPYGIEEHRFEGKIYLGGNYANCCWYKFTFSECCRSGPINTGYSWANFSTELWLNRCITPCDNGPEFKNPPIAIKCAGQDVIYNHGVVDIDGDSLVYKKAIPNGANYSSPWTVNYPLTTFPGNNPGVTPCPTCNPPTGFYLDPITGDLIFRPMQQQETVMKVKVEEWRKINGVYQLIGIATRDMHFIILSNCNNKNPTLSGIQSYQVCTGQQLCFTINTNDQDFADTTRIFWDNAIPAAQWSSNNGTVKRAAGQFCWTPAESDASTLPYYFRATVEDDHCPLNGRATRAYSITVKPTPHADRYYTDLGCGKFRCVSVPKANYYNPTYEFRILNVKYFDDTVIYQFPSGGTYVVKHTITSNLCSDVYFDTLKVDTFVQAFTPNDTFVCRGKPINIIGTAKWGTPPYHYYWSSNDSAASISITPTSDTVLYLMVKDDIGCRGFDSVVVLVKDLPVIPPNTDRRICFGDSVVFDGGNAGKGMIYNWTKNGSYFTNTQTITARDSGQYIIQIIDSFTCDAFDTVNLYVNEPVIVGPLQDVAICKFDTITLQTTGAQVYEWTDLTSNTVVSTTDLLTVNPTSTTTYAIKGAVTYGNVTCYGYDTVKVTVNSLPLITFPTFPKRCINGGYIALTGTVRVDNIVVPPTSVVWTCTSQPNTILLDGITGTYYFDPAQSPLTGGTYYVIMEAMAPNGCKVKDSTTIQIYPLPVISAGGDKVFCENVGSVLLDTMANPFHVRYGIWSILSPSTPAGTLTSVNNPPGYSYYFNTAVAGVGYHQLIYKYKDVVTNCENTDTVAFQVIPVPVANAGTLPQVCTDHGIVDLYTVSGCTPLIGSSWSGPGVNLGFFDPSINNTGSIQTYTLVYSVIAIGCSDVDSTTITVYPIPNTKLAVVGTVCLNVGDITLVGTPVAGGTGTYSGNGVSGNVFNTRTAGVGTHKIKYKFKESSVPYCEKEDSITITVQDEPLISIDPIQVLCEEDIKTNGVTVKCNINSPFGVQWSADSAGGFNDPTSSTTIYHPSAAELLNHKITFTATSTGNGVCSPVQATIVGDIYPTPSVAFDGDSLKGCRPLVVQFKSVTDAGTGAVYSWDFGDPKSGSDNNSDQPDPTHTYTDSGVYTVTLKVTSVHGCFKTIVKTNYIEVFPYPVASFNASPSATTVALPKIKFTNTSRGNEPMHFTWNYGDGNGEYTDLRNTEHMYSPNDTGWYEVVLKTESREGCSDIAIQKVYIGPDVTVFIPNVFSPDGDGPKTNNVFKVVAGGITHFELSIYDRWGEALYTSLNYESHGWDGTYLGKACQDDVYIYKVLVTGYDGRKLEYNGTIILMR